jgi:hypothetical protein
MQRSQKIGIAAKRHKRRQKFGQPNPRYGDHSHKARFEFPPALAELHLALFFAIFVLFCGYSCSLALGTDPTFLRLLCLFAAISVLFYGLRAKARDCSFDPDSGYFSAPTSTPPATF